MEPDGFQFWLLDKPVREVVLAHEDYVNINFHSFFVDGTLYKDIISLLVQEVITFLAPLGRKNIIWIFSILGVFSF